MLLSLYNTRGTQHYNTGVGQIFYYLEEIGDNFTPTKCLEENRIQSCFLKKIDTEGMEEIQMEIQWRKMGTTLQ